MDAAPAQFVVFPWIRAGWHRITHMCLRPRKRLKGGIKYGTRPLGAHGKEDEAEES